MRIGAAILLFAFVMGVALGFPNGHPRPLGQLSRSIHQALLIVTLAGVAWWVFARGRSFSFESVGLFENVLLVASIMLVTEESPATNEVGTALILSAESFFYSFVFFTSCSVGRHTRHPGIFVLGVYYSLGLLAMGVGRLLSTAISSVPGGAVVAALGMSILLVAEMVLGSRLGIVRGDAALFGEVTREQLAELNAQAQERVARERAGAGAGSRPTAGTAGAGEPSARGDEAGGGVLGSGAARDEGEPERLKALASAYGLTPTEGRIAAPIAHGRSRSFIAKELGCSENTVRNYTRSLYQKLGVHSKQELIDLLERQGRGSA